MSSLSTVVGQPATIQWASQQMAASCSFPHSLGGDPATTIQSDIAEDVSTGVSFTVVPVETSDTGLKAYITINQQLAQDHEWAQVNTECRLPVGKSSSASIRAFETFKWGEPNKLAFSDGSEMLVTVSKEYKAAGIDYSKMKAAIANTDQKALDLAKIDAEHALDAKAARKQ